MARHGNYHGPGNPATAPAIPVWANEGRSSSPPYHLNGAFPAAGNTTAIPLEPDYKSLSADDLKGRCVSLSTASSTTKEHYARKIFGHFTDEFGVDRRFNPGSVLLKFKDETQPSLLPVEHGTEVAAAAELRQRDDLAYVELDALMTRQFIPNDEHISTQWHHSILGSSNAWALRTDAPAVRIALVDTPFQMDHPDLAANTAPGWDIVHKREIRSDTIGFFHSTIGAGMAAAVVNNQVGVAGAINARVLPVNINGYLSEMYQAILWCAENQVRVVNLSWDGAYSATINDAAALLRSKIDGMVIMSGVNSRRFLDYPNQPYILAVSMTDQNDLSRSAYGRHIDFAAPGWNIYSTTTNSFYESDSGSSYSAPMVSGIVAALMCINSDLSSPQIEEVLKTSSIDAGPEGWDQYYGWGRVDFGRAALRAATYIRIQKISNQLMLSLPSYSALELSFYQSAGLGEWVHYQPSALTVLSNRLQAETPVNDGALFFRVEGALKR